MKPAGAGLAVGARRLWVYAWVGGYFALVLITEILGRFDALNPKAIAASWCLTAAAVLTVFLTMGPSKGPEPAAAAPAGDGGEPVDRFEFWDAGIALLAVAVVGVTGFIAFWSAPNNYDSMTTHLSRVVYWLQNGSVKHFPTPNVTQIAYPAAAEYGLLHLMALTGSDRFANLLQYLFWIGSALTASLIAAEWNLSRRLQWMTAVFVLTVPIGILEATSTQNDLVVGFFLTCFVYFVLRLERRITRVDLAFCAASFALAIFTKPYALVYGFPFGCWLAWIVVRRMGWQSWQPLLGFAAAILTVNGGLWFRNIQAFGAWMPQGLTHFVLEVFSVKVLAAAWLKNVALHLSTPFEPLNAFLDGIVMKLLGLLGQSASDPRTSLVSPDIRCCVQKFSTNEDFSSNPLHFVLSAAAFPALILLLIRKKIRPSQTVYFLSLAAGATLLCFYLKWHPYFTRYHVFYFAAAAPVVALALLARLPKNAGRFLCAALLLASFLWVFGNDLRPIFGGSPGAAPGRKSILATGRIEQYFAHRPDLQKPYMNAAAWIRENGFSKIGLIGREVDWDYPLWVLLARQRNHPVEMRFVEVKGPAAEVPQAPFEPDVVVCFGLTGAVRDQGELRALQEKYGPIRIFGSIYLMTKKAGLISAPGKPE